MTGPRARLRFFDFELDIRAGRLRRAGQIVRLQPQPLRVLAILAEQAGQVVSRDDLRRQVWDAATFVEFDQGLNYCIRQIRLALGDDAAQPVYLETIKKQGYRFVAPVLVENDGGPEPAGPPEVAMPAASADVPGSRHGAPRFVPARVLLTIAGLLLLGVVGGGWLYRRPHASGRQAGAPLVDIRPITDFADSAVAPALSPDGRMLAFIRGDSAFLTPDQIYVKMLPGGEPRRLTHDPRLKYGPAFSPDGAEVAYTVMEHSGWATYAVSVLGGEPHLVMANAAGLTWLAPHELLFSQIIQGQHMGVVAGTDMRADLRELYTPAHERGMAHYAVASPDHQAALVVEMDEKPVWLPCRLISLSGAFESRVTGPIGPCTSAGWSPDGRWMYFGAGGHLWRQASPAGSPEQLTFGTSSEVGVAVDPDGASLITSIGSGSSTIWLHEGGRERPLSSEGQVVSAEGSISFPAFSADGRQVYYLARRAGQGATQELRRVTIATDRDVAVLPGVSVLEYDVSPDGSRVVYTTALDGGSSQLWIGPLDRHAPPVPIASGVNSPHFGPDGEILVRWAEGPFNYLGRMNSDGSGRAKVVPYPISTIQSVSPARNWVMAIAPLPDRSTVAPMAIPVRGGDPVRICEIFCELSWSTTGGFLLASVEEPSLTSPGRTLAIPVGAGEALPSFPPLGIPPLAKAGIMPGARSIPGARIAAGPIPDTFVYVRASQHRNLFRVGLPSEP